MSARSSWPVAGNTWVASAVSGFSETSTTASTSSVANAASQPGRLRKGGERVAAGDEQRADVSGLDLVDERDRRHLTDHAGKLRPARGGGAARAVRFGSRRRSGRIETAVEVHAGRTIERARRDEHDPAQPLREHAVARHRDAGAALHRDATRRGAHVGDELFEERDVDVGGGRGPFDRERRERAAQCGDLGGIAMLAKLAFVGAVREQRVRQRAEHGDVGAGPDGNVHVGERRGLGAARIEHPDPTAAARYSRTWRTGSGSAVP